MSILKSFKFTRLLLIILVSLVSLTTFPSNGYCDNWVEVLKNNDYTTFYNSSSIKIFQQQKLIEVWGKDVYTEKGKNGLLKLNILGMGKDNLSNLNHTLSLYLFDYKEWKMSLKNITHVSSSGSVLFNKSYETKWNEMKPDSESDILLKKILKDNNIQR